MNRAKEAVLKANAELGSVKDMMDLAQLYFENDRPDDAVQWWLEAANKNNKVAQHLLGLHCKSYLSEKERIEWLTKSAYQKYVPAQHQLGMLYKSWAENAYNRDHKIEFAVQATDWLELALENGHAQAGYELGEMHLAGKAVRKSLQKAFEYFEQAGNQGHAEAQNWLGRFFSEGWEVEKNPDKAVFWLEKAAAQNHAAAQFNLAFCYHHGKGVAPNQEKAAHWYEKAAEQGDLDAQYQTGLAYLWGTGKTADGEKAFFWFEKAASKGSSVAQTMLGNAYFLGLGVQQDCKEAVRCYKSVIEHLKNQSPEKRDTSSYITNHVNLSLAYKEMQNYELAFQTLHNIQNSPKTSTHACFWLGFFLDNGLGTARDAQNARMWFEKAKNKGSKKAEFILGNTAYAQQTSNGIHQVKLEDFDLVPDKGQEDLAYQIALNCEASILSNEQKKNTVWWFKMAARAGHKNAQFRLGCFEDIGFLNEPNKSKAANAYKEALKDGIFALDDYNKKYAANAAETLLYVARVYLSAQDGIINRENAEIAKPFLQAAALLGSLEATAELLKI